MVRAVGGIRNGESCMRDKEVKTSLGAPETLVLLFLPLCGRFLALKFLLLFKLMHGFRLRFTILLHPPPLPRRSIVSAGMFLVIMNTIHNNYCIPYGALTAKDRAVSGGDQ